ncbi:MAG: carbon-nitrogen family hydrolase [Phycisphaeraceae bacterium]|nr:MAG: carbon-nitrogen family hydrolase [Phycisphaeraceae bacterium]
MLAHLVQMNIVWENRHENFTRVDRLLNAANISPGDLVVLPEMFDSGFSLHTDTTRDTDGETEGFLRSLALRLRCTVQGGRTVRPDGQDKATNRATVFAPDGTLLADYAKIHPFSFGREPEAFRGGDAVTTYYWRGLNSDSLRICPAICYDVRFPELFRLGMLRGAEAFAIGANFPAARQDHWRALLIARAIENQAFVFAVNRTGDDPHLHYAGGSIAVGPKGEILGELGDEETVLSVGVDPAAVHAWRETFLAWRDVRLIQPPDAG